ncbi:MBL fold metallo-hydrolase [Rhodococcus fascians]|uniref:MBL fold metallo-hydrolase n=1 Tax=Rhodococcoides fascians TaxID=1828 RepID=UPI00196174E4|nr:MBL fold metallo-hydrolase [Rhodococcus fascians]MBM7244226.1 MBL fold metallo-hydrolase [Rhodococcus fascians]MBY3810418.1 MBL fold metallo-hydrolase [Rhodococcus fascians]MBY3841959.1 MBL fold metallo-hydrolase [Rhodococcus fascians]MBY3844410.1 MBL fold metallo-hydrolase [Rhodococcus fascians]MBY3850356.1 MBL fold metallo-hydrolase [Rhodococcus fascians]
MTQSWNIGDIKVSQINEFAVAVGELDGLIAEATPDAVKSVPWLHPDYATSQGQMLWSVHSFVVDTGSSVVIVDTACGNHKDLPLIPAWGGLDTPYLDRLADAGYKPEQIDYVAITHLHLDHVGWNTVLDGDRWVPTFPNARYTFVEDEFEYHKSLTHGASVTEDLGHAVTYNGADPDIHKQTSLVFQQSLQPCVDAGLVDLVPQNHTICEGVRYTSTPGHTKSHSSLTIESGGQTGFITGDFVHHPIQAARPTWSSRGDWNRELSSERRVEFMHSVADTDVVVFGTHFAGHSVGRIVSDGDAYKFAAI